MNNCAAALRSRLEFRIEHLSRNHPSKDIKKQALALIQTPTEKGFKDLWVAMNLYGPILIIEDVLIDTGLDVCSAAWAGESC